MIEQLQNELSQATCDLINAVAFASEWQGQAVQLRDRIERALQLLRESMKRLRADDEFVRRSYVCEAVQILDGENNG